MNLLERVGLDEELSTILWTIGWENSTTSRAVEGIGWLERWMDDFAHVQMKMQASINSQTSMMYDLFGHLRINPDA
jgi:hypothetical protein